MAAVILIPCLAIPEDMGKFSYFCLPRYSFQMEALSLCATHTTAPLLLPQLGGAGALALPATMLAAGRLWASQA